MKTKSVIPQGTIYELTSYTKGCRGIRIILLKSGNDQDYNGRASNYVTKNRRLLQQAIIFDV